MQGEKKAAQRVKSAKKKRGNNKKTREKETGRWTARGERGARGSIKEIAWKVERQDVGGSFPDVGYKDNHVRMNGRNLETIGKEPLPGRARKTRDRQPRRTVFVLEIPR